MTTTRSTSSAASTRDIAIDTLALNLGVSRDEAWETIKDHANAYGRWPVGGQKATTARAGQIARAMWTDETFVWTPANLKRFIVDITADFVLTHETYIPDIDCEHPMCDQFHKRGCPEPALRSGWYIIDRATGYRSDHASDEYERRADAIREHERCSDKALAR